VAVGVVGGDLSQTATNWVWLKLPPTTPDHHRPVRPGAEWPARPLINYSLVDSLRLHHRLQINKMSVKLTVLTSPNANPTITLITTLSRRP